MTTTATSTRHSFSGLYRPPRRRSLISLTPLIDVVFILLLFFMLASSFTNLHAIVLNAPASGSTSSTPSIEGALLVDVRLDGVRFAGRYVTLKQLIARVSAIRAKHGDRRVLIRPGNGVSLQDTVRVLDALDGAGIHNLQLMDGPGAHSAS